MRAASRRPGFRDLHLGWTSYEEGWLVEASGTHRGRGQVPTAKLAGS